MSGKAPYCTRRPRLSTIYRPLLGSTNLDWLSAELNQEINAVVLGQEFGAQMKAMFDKDIESSWLVTPESWHQRSIGVRLKELGARLSGLMVVTVHWKFVCPGFSGKLIGDRGSSFPYPFFLRSRWGRAGFLLAPLKNGDQVF